MARQTFHPPTGGVGWIDPVTGQGYSPTTGRVSFTPGVTPDQAIAAINAAGGVTGTRGSGTGSGGEGGGVGGAAPGVSDPASAGRQAEFTSILRQYGLDELIPYASQWARTLATPDEMWLQLMDPTTEPGKVVDRIYPELRLRREQGLTSSIAEIRAYHEQGAQLLRAAGLDRVLDTRQFLRDRYVGNVSLNQINERIVGIEDEVARVAADPAVMQELEAYQRFYGVQLTSRDLVAFALDFDKADAVVRRQQRAVQLDVQAGRAGFGDLSLQEAERLATVGVTDQGATEGFGFLADSQGLLNPLLGSQEDLIGRDEALAGVFEGNANARRRIARRARERQSAFEGGGSFTSSADGFSGLGTAR